MIMNRKEFLKINFNYQFNKIIGTELIKLKSLKNGLMQDLLSGKAIMKI
jgi:hypothetical protein